LDHRSFFIPADLGAATHIYLSIFLKIELADLRRAKE
jgi:hypothetical protein